MPPTLRIASLLTLALLPSATASRIPDSPLVFASLLAQYTRAPEGPAKDALAARVDAAAHQKYATVSGLYWYTDLAAAQDAAREQKRPILHLRMLGRLDEDRSCANSRFFRAMLYANAEVSRLLRDRFVLVWTSERAVPTITIDFGDGRKLEQTTTGNSAHYVMDADGIILDVLPGLYAPVAFRRALTHSLALADKVRDASDAERAKAIVDFHRAESAAATNAWEKTAAARIDPAESALARAQMATVSKAAVEVRTLRSFTADLPPDVFPVDRIAQWAQTARTFYGIDRRAKPVAVLDEQSLGLVVRLHDAVPSELRGIPAARDVMLQRLTEHVLADTAIDQLRLRPQISREIVRRGGTVDFATLNAWTYAIVFQTPASDPWLGLVPRTDFTGLPGDGVVMP
jgi:hypothetical protein